MPRKTKRVVYGGPSEELRLAWGDGKLVLPKGEAKKVSDDEYEYLKNCKKKLNVIPVSDWDTNRRKTLKERIIKEGKNED